MSPLNPPTRFDIPVPVKKASGKKTDYWIFVQREGRQTFFNETKRVFNCKDPHDMERMGMIWMSLPAEKRSAYRRETDMLNEPSLVRERRDKEMRDYRAVHNNHGREALRQKLNRRVIEQQNFNERIQQYHPSADGDIALFTSSTPLFFQGEAFQRFQKQMCSQSLCRHKFRLAGKAHGGESQEVLRNTTFMLIKVNVFDAVYVSQAYQARTHPSEIALIIFNIATGVQQTKVIPIKFEPSMLYDDDEDIQGIPLEYYDRFVKMEDQSGITRDDAARRQPLQTVYEAFNTVDIFKDGYNAVPVVQADDWNKVVSSLFFLAHAGRKSAEFKDLFGKMSILEVELRVMHSLWKEVKGDRNYQPNDDDKFECLSIPMIPHSSNSKYYCEDHVTKPDRQKINCALARAANTVHCFFDHVASTRLTGWEGANDTNKFKICMVLEPGMELMKDEIIEPIAEQMARDAPKARVEIMEIVESDDEEAYPRVQRDMQVDQLKQRPIDTLESDGYGRGVRDYRFDNRENERGEEQMKGRMMGRGGREEQGSSRFIEPSRFSAPSSSGRSLAERFGTKPTPQPPRMSVFAQNNSAPVFSSRLPPTPVSSGPSPVSDHSGGSPPAQRPPPRMGATKSRNRGVLPLNNQPQEYQPKVVQEEYRRELPRISRPRSPLRQSFQGDQIFVSSLAEYRGSELAKQCVLHRAVSPPKGETARRLWRFTVQCRVWEQNGSN